MDKNGKIYRLLCNDGHFYIGSTTTSLAKRLFHHKNKSKEKCQLARKVYAHVNKIGWENVSIVLVEERPCESKHQLFQRENFHVEKELSNPQCLNSCRAFVDREVKRQEAIVKARKWAAANPERVKQKQDEYQEKNREKLKVKGKRWREANSEKKKETDAAYREKNRESLREKQKVRIECKCGLSYPRSHRAYHMKSAAHSTAVSNKTIKNSERVKQWRLNNQERFKQSCKERYEQNKEVVLAKMKEYRDTNTEAIAARKKAYREANKDKVAAHKNEKVACDVCNSLISRSNLNRHRRNAHQSALAAAGDR
jgi:predicted GIY-YIG superfamily endonuclease